MWPEGLARPTTANIKTFTPTSNTATALGWQAWTKPPGCSYVYIVACGGGGAGGKSTGGNQSVAAGGGGSGVLGRALFPAFILPDTLFFRIGVGGQTTTVAGTGNPGFATTLAITPEATSTASNILLLCNGGAGGGGAAASAGGGGGTAPTNATQILSNWGFWQGVAKGGTAGATASNGSGTAYTMNNSGGTGSIINGGTGGGNGTGTGGPYSVSTEFKTWIQTTPAPTQTNGISLIKNTALLFNLISSNQPIVFQGGTGGGGTAVSGAGNPAGSGGAGSWGCGGGGGGNSNLNGGVSGNGGAGGDGFAIVIAY